MADETKELAQVVPASPLTAREETALKRHLEGRQKGKEFPLAPSTQAQLFELFLNGLSFDEIIRLNKGIKLGEVVAAAVDGDWYLRRERYLIELLDSVNPRVRQVQSEAVIFASDLLAVAHKQHGDKLKRYLQTGDEAELGQFSIGGLDHYRKVVEMLLKMTGQDGGKGGSQRVPDPPPPKDVGGQTLTMNRPMASKTAEDLLKKLDGEE